MIRLSTLAIILVLTPTTARADKKPKTSADVVSVTLQQGSIADGLETYHVTLTVEKGWHIHAGSKKAEGPATTFEFFLDGRRTDINDVYFPKGVAKKDADGKEYRAHEGTVICTVWLVYDCTKDAKVVTVKVKATATDSKTTLKESIITAEVK